MNHTIRRRPFLTTIAEFLTVLTLAFAVTAAPHDGEEFMLIQPDGSYVRVFVWGDEFYQDVESPDGYTLIRDANGWICYAELSADGNTYVSTDIRYTGGERHTPEARKGLRINMASVSDKQRRNRELLGYDELIEPTVEAQPNAFFPSMTPYGMQLSPVEPRVVVGLTILIDFADLQGRIPREAMIDFCNQAGRSGNGSSYDWFYDVSNGRMLYTNIVTPYIRADSNKTFYDNSDVSGYTHVGMLLHDALLKLRNMSNSGQIDLSSLTTEVSGSGTNRRDVVVALNVFYAGSPAAGWGNGLWPHAGTYRAPLGQSAVTINVNGTIINFSRYQMTNLGTGTNPPGIGTFIHENGHLIMRWPDLYNYDNTIRNFVRQYCVMSSSNGSNPQQPNPYFRNLAGWIDIIDITNMNADVSHIANSHSAFQFIRNNNESYYIEARRSAGRSAVLPGEGLLIWHVHRSGNNTRLNANNPFPLVMVVEASSAGDNPPNANATFRAGHNTSFNNTTTPAARYHDGTASPIQISQISAIPSNANNNTMTFRIGTGGERMTFRLTVINGTGSGDFPHDTTVAVKSAPTNATGLQFLRWRTNNARTTPANIYACTTTVRMGTANDTITAFYSRHFSLPGRIEADTFGLAEGVTGVSSSNATGNRAASFTATSRFAEYAVNIHAAGQYTISYRAASTSGGRAFLHDMTTNTIIDTLIIPATGGTNTYREVTGRTLQLGQGRATWRIDADTGVYRLDWFAAHATTVPVLTSHGFTPIFDLKATPAGNISFRMAKTEQVSVRLYDMRGRNVAVLNNGIKQPGVYNINIANARLGSGMYVVRMQSESFAKDIRVNYRR